MHSKIKLNGVRLKMSPKCNLDFANAPYRAASLHWKTIFFHGISSEFNNLVFLAVKTCFSDAS